MNPQGDEPNAVHDRERDFWGHTLPTVQQVLDEVEAGPDPNTRAMLDAVEPIQNKRALDFACGAGSTTMWLALRGARVTGLDITPESIALAREVARLLGIDAEFVVCPIEHYEPAERFDAIVGRFALHHVEIEPTAVLLSRLMSAGARAAFLETMATNPILMFARRHLIGRWGIPRLGTLDEHPLTERDLRLLEECLGELHYNTADPVFLGVLDRQVLRYRWPRVSRACGGFDRHFLRCGRAERWSYQQVISFHRREEPAGERSPEMG